MPDAPLKLTRRDVLAFVVCLAGSTLALNTLASVWLRDQKASSLADRPPYVVGVPKLLTELPPDPGDRPLMLLIGNSHTYGLPGLERGQPLRPETTGTLIDELARRVEPSLSGPGAAYYRLSYPNFLPFEVLTSVSHLIYEGYRPRVVVMGWTWANISRQRNLRHDVAAVYHKGPYVAWLREQLAEQPAADTHDVLAAIDGEVRKAQREAEEDRMQSDADRLDGEITDWLGEYVTLIGRSAELRGRLYKNLVDRLQESLVHNIKNYQYGVVESDLDFNLKCMRLLLRLLAEHDVSVLVYYAPQRSDLPAFTDSRQESQVTGSLSDETRQLGFTVVDATPVVPNEYWGWADFYPDRAHFTEPGHRLLAQFLFDEGGRAKIWHALRREGHSAARTHGKSTAP